MALPYEEMKELEIQLRALLPQLKAGEIHAIEYGNPVEPRGIYSAFRIYYFKTAGGLQYSLKELITFRGESTYGYYQDSDVSIEQLITKATDCVIYYNRDSVNTRHRLAGLTRYSKLAWFAIQLTDTQKPRQIISHLSDSLEKDFNALFGESELVTLVLPEIK